MKSTQGCWTCKHRKIGCDKTIPACNNCLRTGRPCAGYQVRLIWPDQLRARRKGFVANQATEAVDVRAYPAGQNRRFLNYTHEDFVFAKGRLSWQDLMETIPARPTPSLSFHSPVVGEDAMLMAYYEHIVAPMCSTTRALNGFECHILPMALSGRDTTAEALCSSMLAISAHHRHGPGAAFSYRIKAIRGLSASLAASSNDTSAREMVIQLATSMMLCMYCVFDEQETQFHLHLDGTKKILSNWHHRHRQDSSSVFLTLWVLYYEVLGGFAQPSQRSQGALITSICPSEMQMSTQIIGLLGCSGLVFGAISSINRMRPAPLNRAHYKSGEDLLRQRVVSEQKLQKASQWLSPGEFASSTEVEIKNASATAELYRLAALLYLQRVVPADGDDTRRITYVQQAFTALAEVRVATSPWPVFVVACESRTDEERIHILEIFDRMDRLRNVGNVRVLRTIVEMTWKQQDLQSLSNSLQPMQWWL